MGEDFSRAGEKPSPIGENLSPIGEIFPGRHKPFVRLVKQEIITN
jgi:hypothetical protein